MYIEERKSSEITMEVNEATAALKGLLGIGSTSGSDSVITAKTAEKEEEKEENGGPEIIVSPEQQSKSKKKRNKQILKHHITYQGSIEHSKLHLENWARSTKGLPQLAWLVALDTT